jgi:hypothetical protein
MSNEDHVIGQIQDILLRVAKAKQKLSLEGRSAEHARTMDEIIELVQAEMRPQLSSEIGYLFLPRTERKLSNELNRIYEEALHLYTGLHREVIADVFGEDVAQRMSMHGLRQASEHELEKLLIPLLDARDGSSESLGAYVIALMIGGDREQVIKLIASTGKTPPQLKAAFHAIFGYLEKAKLSIEIGDEQAAASYLIDAAHMLGLHRGAAYGESMIDSVSRRRQATNNSERSREKKRRAQGRAYDLYFSLRGDALPRPLWASSKDAMENIWRALCVSEEEPEGITERTLEGLCRKWFKDEQAGSPPSLFIRLPNGDEVRIPDF